jgi:hypothetical protein
VLALGELGQAPIGAVADDRAKAGQVREARAQELARGHDVVRPGEHAPAATGNPRISTRSVRFVPIVRPPGPLA